MPHAVCSDPCAQSSPLADRRARWHSRPGARPDGSDRPAPRLAALSACALLLIFSLACNEADEGAQSPALGAREAADTAAQPTSGAASALSPSARPETWAMLKADLDEPRDASDGGGRAWLEAAGPGEARPRYAVGTPQRFEIVFEAGPLGVASGGVVFLQPSPFWGWDEPQIRQPDAPGYCEITSEAEGVELAADDSIPGLLAITIAGRRLAAGERLRIVYGAGPAGAHVDRFAEDESPLYIAVDGDGDGVRALIAQPPRIDLIGRVPQRLQITLPSTARPGETLALVVAALDLAGNPGRPESDAAVAFVDPPAQLALPERVEFRAGGPSQRRLRVRVTKPGLFRLRARGEGGLAGLLAESNPMRVRAQQPRLLWGDLHGHSQISDGSGTPEQYFAYARDVAGLDVAALTDHDHWGLRPLDSTPELWRRIQSAVRNYHEPGRFVAVLGYEWTHWLHGHRHVLFFADEATLRSSLDPAWDTPDRLWQGLRGSSALTLAHHSAGGPVATNWLYAPDPELEPLTEIVSVHGSSEAPDSPGVIYDAVPGNFVRDALAHGYRLGFIGSGDSHDGHPGLAQLASGSGHAGLAAIWSEARTRASVLEALRARRTYATNGPRIALEVRLDGAPMGSLLPPAGEAPAPEQQLEIEIAACAPIDRVDLVRGGRVATLPGEGRLEWSERRSIPRLQPGEYHYVRVVQQDGGAAWSSPIFAR